ncbi:hypothetical protein BC828DRAFT_80785 [Blastocladiella britannica]|nr:hypothetical protein BC828DRAFT_80785 [Blastocladiella britannica]
MWTSSREWTYRRSCGSSRPKRRPRRRSAVGCVRACLRSTRGRGHLTATPPGSGPRNACRRPNGSSCSNWRLQASWRHRNGTSSMKRTGLVVLSLAPAVGMVTAVAACRTTPIWKRTWISRSARKSPCSCVGRQSCRSSCPRSRSSRPRTGRLTVRRWRVGNWPVNAASCASSRPRRKRRAARPRRAPMPGTTRCARSRPRRRRPVRVGLPRSLRSGPPMPGRRFPSGKRRSRPEPLARSPVCRSRSNGWAYPCTSYAARWSMRCATTRS